MSLITSRKVWILLVLIPTLSYGQTALEKLSSLREAEAYNQLITVGNEYLNNPEINDDTENIDLIYLQLLRAYIEVGRQNSVSNKPEEVIRRYKEGSEIAEKLYALEDGIGLENRYYMSYENFYVQFFLYFKDLWEIDYMEDAMQKLQEKQS